MIGSRRPGPIRRGARDERGQAIAYLAVVLSALLVAGGAGIDAAVLFAEHRREQVSADAAAYAAAVEMAKNWNAGDRATRARNAALAYAASNGYDNDGVSNTVTVNIPPTSGAFVGNSAYTEVYVSVNVRTAFIRILGTAFNSREVRARAVGGITTQTPYSVIALSRTASPGLRVTGTGELETEGAGVMVNSGAAVALEVLGSAELEVENGGLNVVGGATITGDVQPLPTLGAPPITDPLAYLPRPTGVGLSSFPGVSVTSGTTTISPGIYPSLSASGNGKIKMLSGTYIIAGGGISVTGNGRIEDDSSGDSQGVFIFNACAGFPGTSGACGSISISGNGRIELEQERTGAYAGMSIWQPCENTQPLTVTGTGGGAHLPHNPGGDGDDDEDGELETDGSVYLPCADVQVSGNGEFEIDNGQLVASTVSVTGNGELEVEWETGASTVVRIPRVVE